MCKNGHNMNILAIACVELSRALISIIRSMIQVCKRRSIVMLLRLGLEHASKSHNTP